ncbi:outer membrane protein assembly factor BamB [Paenibacillus sp. PastF-3]|uniref:outer membrane protein assembly factor BamB family protein n=1 Tax=Paenibacillus sp. PastF-3 TaxID=2940626 RepID=UPI0024745FF1|nr:PQQ-binding-like beta-propeller repeat protein [Paenibacillus sp. PastF-3]MDH6373782.1 outer membrane protein assembly factor BamB [Paenibacillus sp. PastF-3]
MRKIQLFVIISLVTILTGCMKESDVQIPDKEIQKENVYFPIYPSLDENNVYFGAGTGSFYALDKKNGALKWEKKAVANLVNTTTVTNNGIVAYRDEASLIGVDAISGKEKWKLKDNPSYPYIASDGSLYYSGINQGTNKEMIKNIDITTGKTNWEYETVAETASQPTLVDDVLYIGGFSYIYGYNINSNEYWEYKINEEENKAFGVIQNPLVVTQNNVVFGTGGFIYAVDIKTHQLNWKYETEISNGDYYISASKGDVFLGDGDYIIAIDDAYGTVKWRFNAKGLSAPATIEEEILYFGSGNYLFAISAIDGSEIWKYKSNDTVGSKPVISDGQIYFGCFDGFFYAADIKNGQAIWKYDLNNHKVSNWRKIEEKTIPEPSVSDIVASSNSTAQTIEQPNPIETPETIEPNNEVDFKNWETYRNERFGYIFKYPKNWNLGVLSGDMSSIEITKGKEVSLSAYAGFYMEEFAKDLTNYDKIKLKNNEEAYLLITLGEEITELDLRYILDNSIEYLLGFKVSTKYYNENKEIIDAVINSYEFSKGFDG